MKYKRILNNNVVVASDDQNNECIVIGKGIGFGLVPGNEIPFEKIERIFSSNENKTRLQKLVEEIPQKFFYLAEEIIVYAESMLEIKLSDTIYISLTDHISFIKERLDQGFSPKNSLKWEISQYYPKEYKIGKKAVEMLEDEFDISINDDESASIALHIVNAELNSDIHESIEGLHLIDRIMQILKYQLQLTEDINDFDYQRLIIHVKFFVKRILSQSQVVQEEPLFEVVRKQYPDAYSISEKIRQYVEKKLNRSVSNNEITYLIIHIQRLLNKL